MVPPSFFISLSGLLYFAMTTYDTLKKKKESLCLKCSREKSLTRALLHKEPVQIFSSHKLFCVTFGSFSTKSKFNEQLAVWLQVDSKLD